jgi:hypothetical protein
VPLPSEVECINIRPNGKIERELAGNDVSKGESFHGGIARRHDPGSD